MAMNTISEAFPYFCVADADAALAFYGAVFSAEELFRLTEPNGRVGHLELRIGPMTLMLSEPFPEMNIRPPSGNEGAYCLHLHVDDCDEMAQRALESGAEILSGPADQFYGERSCRIRDPFGHHWLLGHSIEEISHEEMQRRYTALFG
jgi:uncharacterized glyoxalase superfamily protein PhnB